MSAEDFKGKAAAAAGDVDLYDLCLTYLRSMAKTEDQPVAIKALDIFEEVMS